MYATQFSTGGRCALTHFLGISVAGARQERSSRERCKQPLCKGFIPGRRFKTEPEHSDNRSVNYFTELEWTWERVPRCEHDARGQATGFVR